MDALEIQLMLENFKHYMYGGSPEALKKFMKRYDRHANQLVQNCDTQIDNLRIKPIIENILFDLEIPQERWAHYFKRSLSIYEFLVRLYLEGFIQIGYIIKLIDQKIKTPRWILALGGFFMGLYTVSMFSTPALLSMWQISKNFLLSGMGLPILGVFSTCLMTLVCLYKNAKDSKKSKFNRWRDYMFILSYALLSLLGSAVWIASGVAVNPVVALLFTAAAFIDVVKELFWLGQEYWRYHYHPERFLLKKINHIRHKFSYRKHRNAAMINIFAASLIVGVMITWCVSPPSIYLTLGALTAFVLVYTVKAILVAINDYRMRNLLQVEVKAENCRHQPSYIHFPRLAEPLKEEPKATYSKCYSVEFLLNAFFCEYERRLSAQQLNFFRKPHYDYKKATLTKIIKQGILKGDELVHEVILNLGWIDKHNNILLPQTVLCENSVEKPTLAPRTLTEGSGAILMAGLGKLR